MSRVPNAINFPSIFLIMSLAFSSLNLTFAQPALANATPITAPTSLLTAVATSQTVSNKTEQPGIQLIGDKPIVETSQQIMQRQLTTPDSAFQNQTLPSLPNDTQFSKAAIPEAAASESEESNVVPQIELPSYGITPNAPQTSSISFTGATLADTNAFPPDSMGTVGPSQYIVTANGRFRSFNKNTGQADGVINVHPNVFFSSVLSTQSGTFTMSPRVRYDRVTQRWFIVVVDVPAGTGAIANKVLIAVSDAASAGVISNSTLWSFYFFSPSANFVSYPSLGVDANALYIGANILTLSGSFASTDGYVVQKSSLLNGGPIKVTIFAGLVASGSGAGPFSPQGVDNFDTTATEGYFIGVDNATFSTLMLRRVSNPGSNNPTISGNISLTVPSTAFPVKVPHLGNTGSTNGNLTALDDRLFAAVIRNGRLWTAHNIGVNTSGVASTATGVRNAVRWYELQNLTATPSLVQSGTIFDSAANNPNFYWIPTVMVSGQGHVAMGFSTAGANARINAATAGRLKTDASGTTQSVYAYTNSSTAYNPPGDTGSTNGRRWGSYSYTSLDPDDDMTMWTIQQFCDATNSYAVQVIKLLAPPPATPSAASPVSVTNNLVSVPVTITGVSTNGSGFYDPGAGFPKHITATVSGGVVVNSVTYISPTQVVLDLNTTGANPGLQNITITNPDGQTATGNVILSVTSVTPPTLSINDVSVTEGNSGTTNAVFTATLSTSNPNTITVNYASADGTATLADNDYIAASGTITFAPGVSSQTITVAINGDIKLEPDETFTVTLSNPTGATLNKASGTATIINDDTAPLLSLVGGQVLEGDIGTASLLFTATLSAASPNTVTVSYASADGPATIADNDYVAASGTITFAPGITTQVIALTINGDTKVEPDEAVILSLSNPINAILGIDSSVFGLIVNDDNCNPLAVTSTADDDSCGTLRAAVAAATGGQTITINLSADAVITLTSGLVLNSNVALVSNAGCANGPTITIVGTGANSGNGLTLNSGNYVYGIQVRGFSDKQINAPYGGSNLLRCVKVSKS